MAYSLRIESMKHIPRTEHSIPWNAADRQLVPIDLDRYGYDEEEYFFSGKANVYTLNGDHAEMKSEAAPYTNRFLIRKPKDMKKFSGKVVMELINPTNGWDVVPMWCQIWPSILQDGDIYVGITIREGCIASLKKYDPERYAELDWTNPNKEPGEISKKILMWQHCSKETEYGLFWDMLTQLGYFFKEKEGAELVGAPVEKVYAIGCSQSGMYLSAYFNVFHETDRPSPIDPPFDGYLSYTGSMMVPLNQEEDPPEATDPIQVTKNCPVPVIRIMSQWDFRDFAGHISHRRPDGDEIGDRFRLYEIASHAHNTLVGGLYRPGREEMKALGQKTQFPATDFSPLPLDAVMRQAVRNLDMWSRQNIAPPHAPAFIETDENGYAALDENGNCKGGLRLPQIDVPVAAYHSGTKTNDQDSCYVPFSTEKLKELYPTHEDYVLKMFTAIDKMLEQNFISVQDADQMKVRAVMAPIPELDHNAL